MPKRTNDFQRLVALVHRVLAPAGAKITESAMVRAPGFGELREIDVLMESNIEPYQMKIAIEAKDHKRKLSVTDIEAIIGKYRAGASLIVDKVVLVSRRGFSNQAAAKAKANGISLLTLSEVSLDSLVGLLPAETSKRVLKQAHIRVKMEPMVAKLRVRPFRNEDTSGVVMSTGRVICRCHRNDFGNPYEYATRVLKHHLITDKKFKADFDASIKKQGKVCARVLWPMAQFVLKTNKRDIELIELSFHVHAAETSSPMHITSYQLSGDGIKERMIQHATADIAGQKVDFIMPDGVQSKKMVIQFGDCKPKK